MTLRQIKPPFPIAKVEIARPIEREGNPLYTSPEWRSLVDKLIKKRGRICQGEKHKGNRDLTGRRVFGDHVKELRDGGAPLDPDNVELLCGSCHTAKTNRVRAARMRAIPHRQG